MLRDLLAIDTQKSKIDKSRVESQKKILNRFDSAGMSLAIVALLDCSASTGDAERLLRGSEFFRGLVERHIRWLAQDADLTATNLAGEFDTFEARLSAEGSALESEVALTSALRVLRQRAMLHIVWRSFTSETGLDETLSTMSALADCVIRVAVRFAEATLAKRFGYPIGEESGIFKSELKS